jgi:hypothetical protein
MEVEVHVSPTLQDDDPLGEDVERVLRDVLKDPRLTVERVETCTLEVKFDAFVAIKGILQDTLEAYYDPDYDTDVEVQGMYHEG